MSGKESAFGSNLAKVDATTDKDIERQIADDPDTAPEVTDEMFERAEFRIGNKVVRRGRPPLDTPKQQITVRLDQDVIDHFRAAGPGWQSRINAALRAAIAGDSRGTPSRTAIANPRE